MPFFSSLPDPVLQPYIRDYWVYHGVSGGTINDHSCPDGCMELVFNVETDVYKHLGGLEVEQHPPIELIGQLTKAYQLIATGSQLYFGIRFYPHGFSAFTALSVDQFNNQTIDANMVFSEALEALVEKCDSMDKFSLFVQRSNRFFKQHLQLHKIHAKGYRLVEQVVTSRMLGSAIGIAGLAQHYDCSERWLQRQFQHHIGVPPKTLQKIKRFNRAIYFLEARSGPLTSVALECGYFDQSHFNREFKQLSGVSPTDFQTQIGPINRCFYSESELS